MWLHVLMCACFFNKILIINTLSFFKSRYHADYETSLACYVMLLTYDRTSFIFGYFVKVCTSFGYLIFNYVIVWSSEALSINMLYRIMILGVNKLYQLLAGFVCVD